MPIFLLSLFGKLGIPPQFRKAALIGTAVVLLIALLAIGKCAYDRSVIRQHEQKLEQRAKPATDKAASERAADTINNAKREEELHNAVHSVPDAAPAGPSHALACERLRHAGKHPASCR
jgi:hypothetical protein